jgi:hypothetical protein
MLKVRVAPLMGWLSLGAGICAMIGAKVMQASKIASVTAVLFMRVRTTVTLI